VAYFVRRVVEAWEERIGATSAISAPITMQSNTENVISFVSVSFASSILPAPRSCPTMMATESPSAMKTTLNRFEIVLEIFIAATTFSPRTE